MLLPANRDLVEELLAVLEVSRDLAESTDLPALLNRITESATRVLNCERASVFLHDRATGELRSLAATGVVDIRFPATLGIAGEAFRTGSMLNIPDAYADARFNPEIDRRTGFRTRNLLTCPFGDRDQQRVGVLQAINKRNGQFDDTDELLARTFSAQAGVAIQRQRLLDEWVRTQRIERDLELAREIQQAQLPKAPPRIPGFDIAGWNRPADHTGGDFYDWIVTPNGRLAVVVADVSGHGIGPAVVAAECRALVRSAARRNDRVDEILAETNAFLCDDLPGDRFVTAFLGILDPESATMQFVSAGQGPVLFREHGTGAIRELPIKCPPLGLSSDARFGETDKLSFAPGDVLAIATDGFFEGGVEKDNAFGIERVSAVIDQQANQPSSVIIDTLYRAINEFVGQNRQTDDLTVIIIKAL
jgi:phosphoserine phosphatase